MPIGSVNLLSCSTCHVVSQPSTECILAQPTREIPNYECPSGWPDETSFREISPSLHGIFYRELKQPRGQSILLTALLNVAVLPPDEWVHGVAPRRVLDTPAVPAKVGGVLHLGEHVGGRGVHVGVAGVPGLAVQAPPGLVHGALVVAAVALHAVGWKKKEMRNLEKRTLEFCSRALISFSYLPHQS